MNRKVYIGVGFILSIIIAFLGFSALLHSNSAISNNDITSNIERQLISRLKDISNVDSKFLNVEVELNEYVNNKVFVVYSFNNPPSGYKCVGYEVYEIMTDKKLRPVDLGWGTNDFNLTNLDTNVNGKKESYVMVYGINKPNEKLIYEYTCGTQKRIEEFSGNFFVRKYPSIIGTSTQFQRIVTK